MEVVNLAGYPVPTLTSQVGETFYARLVPGGMLVGTGSTPECAVSDLQGEINDLKRRIDAWEARQR